MTSTNLYVRRGLGWGANIKLEFHEERVSPLDESLIIIDGKDNLIWKKYIFLPLPPIKVVCCFFFCVFLCFF